MRASPKKRLFRFLLLVVAIMTLPMAGATSPDTTSQKIATVQPPAPNAGSLRPTQSGVSRTDPVGNDSGTVMVATLNVGGIPAYVLGGPTMQGSGGSVGTFKASTNDAVLTEETSRSDGTSPTNWEGILSTFLLLGFFLSRRAG